MNATNENQLLSHLPREKYDALKDRANISTLKAFEKSPLHYVHALANPREEADPLRLGNATHLAAFEPARYEAEVVTWSGGRRAGKLWDAFEEANAGRTILTTDQREAVDGMVASVRANPAAARLLEDGEPEKTLLWTDAETGIRCKGRFDWLALTGSLVDLKTTRDASPAGFGRLAWNAHYHAQAAFYIDGIRAIHGVDFRFVLIAVENEAPFASCVYVMPQTAIDAGRALYRKWLRRLAECRASGEWPGYVAGESMLEIPRWADAHGEAADPLPEEQHEQ